MVFSRVKHELSNFPDELQRLAKDAIIHNLYLPECLFIRRSHLIKPEHSTHEQVVKQPEIGLKLNGLTTQDKLPVNKVNHKSPKNEINLSSLENKRTLPEPMLYFTITPQLSK